VLDQALGLLHAAGGLSPPVYPLVHPDAVMGEARDSGPTLNGNVDACRPKMSAEMSSRGFVARRARRRWSVLCFPVLLLVSAPLQSTVHWKSFRETGRNAQCPMGISEIPYYAREWAFRGKKTRFVGILEIISRFAPTLRARKRVPEPSSLSGAVHHRSEPSQ